MDLFPRRLTAPMLFVPLPASLGGRSFVAPHSAGGRATCATGTGGCDGGGGGGGGGFARSPAHPTDRGGLRATKAASATGASVPTPSTPSSSTVPSAARRALRPATVAPAAPAGDGGRVGATCGPGGSTSGSAAAGRGIATNPNERSGGGSARNASVRRQVRELYDHARACERAGSLAEARSLLVECLALDRRDAHSWLALARLEARAAGLAGVRSVDVVGTGASPAAAHSSSGSGVGGGGSSNSFGNVPGAAVVLREDAPAAADAFPAGGDGRGLDVAATARRVFQQGLAECPDNVHLLQAWAVLEHRCGNNDSARELFACGLRLSPDNAYVCQAWGLLEQRTGNTAAARALFERSVALRPQREVCSAWAVLEAREGDYVRARELFQMGLTVPPEVADTPTASIRQAAAAAALLRAWADMEERAGDVPRARALLVRALGVRRGQSATHVALGKLEARGGNTARARELLHAALSMDDVPPASAYHAIAQLEATSFGDVATARELLLAGHAAHPQDSALLQSLGMIETRAGNRPEARDYFRRSVAAAPTAAAFVAWALLEAADGATQAAVDLFERALASDPRHGPAYNAYGALEARRGRIDSARAVFDRGLAAGASVSVLHGYGQLELKLGRVDRARSLFQRGVACTREDTSYVWHSWGMLELHALGEGGGRRPPLQCLLTAFGGTRATHSYWSERR